MLGSLKKLYKCIIILICLISRFNHSYCEEMKVEIITGNNVWSRIKKMLVILAHLKLWLALARHNKA